MINNLMYIELKTGYSDDGPAWIGYVKTSKSKKTIYFNDHAFQKNIGKDIRVMCHVLFNGKYPTNEVFSASNTT